MSLCSSGGRIGNQFIVGWRVDCGEKTGPASEDCFVKNLGNEEEGMCSSHSFGWYRLMFVFNFMTLEPHIIDQPQKWQDEKKQGSE